MFLAYAKQCLAPTIKRGDIVIMDNLPMPKNLRSAARLKRQVCSSFICLRFARLEPDRNGL
jgi:hypothetical protein